MSVLVARIAVAAIKSYHSGCVACCDEAPDNDPPEIGKSGKWLLGVVKIVIDLLQHGAEDGIFGHPPRDALDAAAKIQRFPCANKNWHVVT